MKQAIYVFLIAAAILFGVGFAYRNAQPVSVSFYFGLSWDAPLAMVLLTAFAIGAVAGLLASVRIVLRAQHDLNQSRRELREAEDEARRLRQLPIRDML
jgi:uncharacterized integral membrane protein